YSLTYYLSFLFTHPSPTDIYTLSLHDALPISVSARCPELCGLWCSERELGNASNKSNGLICVGQYKVTRICQPHVVVETIACAALVGLRRPKVLTFNLLIEGLLVIDPPELHATS